MTEEQFQKQVVAYLDVVLPHDCFYTAINPIPSKTIAVAARSKTMGMKAGVPDLMLNYDRKAFWLELKTTKGRLSPAQIMVRSRIREAGGEVYVCSTLEEVRDALISQGVPIREAL